MSETTPAIYLKLARTCRDIGELDMGITACEKGIARFSNDALLHHTKGELHIIRFNKNKSPSELKLAVKCFEAALTINPHNYLSKFLSGQIYMRGGAHTRAKEMFNSILKTAPDDAGALKFLKEIKIKEETKFKKVPKADESRSAGMEAGGVSIEERSSINYKPLIKQLYILKKIDGITGLFLIDRYGMIIKNFNRSNIEENLLSAISANIFRSSQSGLQKIGLGNFRNGMLMSPLGNFYIVNVCDAIIVILTDVETNQKDVDDIIQNYLLAVSY